MAPKRGPAPIAAKPGRPLLRPCCPLLCRAVVGLLKEDDVPPVALQKVEEAAPLVSVPEAVDVEAEKAQGGRSFLFFASFAASYLPYATVCLCPTLLAD